MRKRMARIPFGASLVKNNVSAAPGFQIENVFVMAGVPNIMQAMLEDIGPRLVRGRLVKTVTVSAPIAEGTIAAALAKLQGEHDAVAIGSYPYYREDGYGVQLVARGRDAAQVEKVAQALEEIVRNAGAKPLRHSP
jgi:molybdopterin-biosynthesis enzyme MoeA-like protein